MFVRIVQDIKNVKVRNIVLVRIAPKRNGRMVQSSAITRRMNGTRLLMALFQKKINAIKSQRSHREQDSVTIEAVLSGTLNFVFNTLAEDVSFSQAVRLAQELGYSEPDPRIDLSGKDVIRKLTILARESGFEVETTDIARHDFIPSPLFTGTLEAFWESLPNLDADFERERKRLAAEGKRWRFVATGEDGHGSVGLREIPQGHPFYDLEGSNNIILLTTERYHEYPMLIQGYGAGAAVTAAGVFADIMRVANV